MPTTKRDGAYCLPDTGEEERDKTEIKSTRPSTVKAKVKDAQPQKLRCVLGRAVSRSSRAQRKVSSRQGGMSRSGNPESETDT